MFGITIRQAYEYYTTPSNDPIVQKLIVSLFRIVDLSSFLCLVVDWLGLVNFELYPSSTVIMIQNGLLQLVGHVPPCILNVLGVFFHPPGARLH